MLLQETGSWNFQLREKSFTLRDRYCHIVLTRNFSKKILKNLLEFKDAVVTNDVIQRISSDIEAMWNLGLSSYILYENTLCIIKMSFDISFLGRCRESKSHIISDNSLKGIGGMQRFWLRKF